MYCFVNQELQCFLIFINELLFKIGSSTVDLGLDESDYNFAIDGKSFATVSKYFPDIYEKMLINGSVYARMTPDQKAQLVESLISIGYCVSMCGDGANDCSALKAGNFILQLLTLSDPCYVAGCF